MTPVQRIRFLVWLQRKAGLLVFGAAGLLVAAQLVGWSRAYLELRDADTLIASAETVLRPKADENGSNSGQAQPPKDDIFKRIQISYQLTGIINDQAIINGQMVKAGDRIQSATVMAVEPTRVLIHEDGKPSERELGLFPGGGGGPPMMGGPPSRGGGRRDRMAARGGVPDIPGGAPPGLRNGRIPRDANLGRLNGKSIQEVMRGLRDGTIGIDEIPEEHRERARAMMEGRGGRRGRR